jgi:hypothetical protein
MLSSSTPFCFLNIAGDNTTKGGRSTNNGSYSCIPITQTSILT